MIKNQYKGGLGLVTNRINLCLGLGLHLIFFFYWLFFILFCSIDITSFFGLYDDEREPNNQRNGFCIYLLSIFFLLW